MRRTLWLAVTLAACRPPDEPPVTPYPPPPLRLGAPATATPKAERVPKELVAAGNVALVERARKLAASVRAEEP